MGQVQYLGENIGGESFHSKTKKSLWSVFSQTMTVGLKPVALPVRVNRYGNKCRRFQTPEN